MANPYFTSRQITPNTFIISGAGCDSYLLLGKEEALMIDAGQSEHNIRAYAQTLTSLPVLEANYRRGEFEGASLIYCNDLIWDKDYEHADDLPIATKAHIKSSDFARK